LPVSSDLKRVSLLKLSDKMVSGHLGTWTSQYWTYATSRYSVLEISVLNNKNNLIEFKNCTCQNCKIIGKVKMETTCMWGLTLIILKDIKCFQIWAYFEGIGINFNFEWFCNFDMYNTDPSKCINDHTLTVGRTQEFRRTWRECHS
jgi:hypothetical protein